MTSAQKLRWKTVKKKAIFKRGGGFQLLNFFNLLNHFLMSLPSPAQNAAWKKMHPSEKYQLLVSTIRQARNFKRMGIKLCSPDASPLEIEQKLARIWLHARP